MELKHTLPHLGSAHRGSEPSAEEVMTAQEQPPFLHSIAPPSPEGRSLLSAGKDSSQRSQALRPDERGRRLTASIRRFTAGSRARPRHAHHVPGVFSRRPRAQSSHPSLYRPVEPPPIGQFSILDTFIPHLNDGTILKFSPSLHIPFKRPNKLPREPGVIVFLPCKVAPSQHFHLPQSLPAS